MVHDVVATAPAPLPDQRDEATCLKHALGTLVPQSINGGSSHPTAIAFTAPCSELHSQ